MGSFSLLHWVVVLAVVMLLFGAGKIPRLMGDVAKGIKNFKEGMKEDAPTAAQPPQVGTQAQTTGATKVENKADAA